MANLDTNYFDSFIPKISGDERSRKTAGGGSDDVGRASSNSIRDTAFASQLGDSVSAFDQDGTSPTAAVVVSESQTKIKEVANKTTTEHSYPATEGGNSTAVVSGRRHSAAKVYIGDDQG